MKFTEIGEPHGDCTQSYTVTEYKAKTVEEFVKEVLEQQPDERGRIKIEGRGSVEYEDGKLITGIPLLWQYLEIEEVKANGGWGAMDYTITPKESAVGQVLEAKQLSYENSKRIVERKYAIEGELLSAIMDGYRESHELLIREVNRMLYEKAEQANMTLWELCFSVVPKITQSENFSKKYFSIENTLSLELMPLELKRGDSYWKDRYFNLKKQLQNLIDSKDDIIKEDEQ